MVDVARLLETMHPMREPPPPAPIAPYLVMLGLGCAAAGVLLFVAWQMRRRRMALRASAEAALAASRGLAPADRLAAQAHLLRRLARRLDGDAAARASGDDWLQRLDRIFDTRFFTDGAGAIFGDKLYRQPAGVDVDALDRSLSGLIAQLRRPRASAG